MTNEHTVLVHLNLDVDAADDADAEDRARRFVRDAILSWGTVADAYGIDDVRDVITLVESI